MSNNPIPARPVGEMLGTSARGGKGSGHGKYKTEPEERERIRERNLRLLREQGATAEEVAEVLGLRVKSRRDPDYEAVAEVLPEAPRAETIDERLCVRCGVEPPLRVALCRSCLRAALRERAKKAPRRRGRRSLDPPT